jgi:hypothetical protein
MEKVNKAMPEVKEILTPSLYRKLKNFVDTYNKFGIPYFKETGCLPIRGKRRKVAREATSAEVMKHILREEEGKYGMNPPDPFHQPDPPKHVIDQMIQNMFGQKNEKPTISENKDDVDVSAETIDRRLEEMERKEMEQYEDVDIPDEVLEKMENTGDDFFDIPSQEEINSILEKAFGADATIPEASGTSLLGKVTKPDLKIMEKGVFPCQPVTHQAFIFRSQIRMGTDFFHDLILVNALKPTVTRLSADGNISISYPQGEEEFGANCTFFTDSWGVRNAIQLLLNDLALNPAYLQGGGKRSIILRSATVKPDPAKSFFCSNIYLTLEEGISEANSLHQNEAIRKGLKNLQNCCDWSVLTESNGICMENPLLISQDTVKHKAPVFKGVTHKFTFFQS